MTCCRGALPQYNTTTEAVNLGNNAQQITVTFTFQQALTATLTYAKEFTFQVRADAARWSAAVINWVPTFFFDYAGVLIAVLAHAGEADDLDRHSLPDQGWCGVYCHPKVHHNHNQHRNAHINDHICTAAANPSADGPDCHRKGLGWRDHSQGACGLQHPTTDML